MIPYYKATRVDGTSFYDQKTKWEVGKTVRIPKNQRHSELCGAGLLHVSDAPGETLIGGSWPCRLFLVKPGEIIASQDHKHGARSVKVLEELAAWQALGPNGEAVAALIDRAGQVTSAEAKKLYAAWDAAWSAAWYAARSAAWDAARSAAWYAAWSAAWDAAWSAAWYAAWYAAWSAAWSAATALVTEDLITSQQFDILYGPWQKVIG